MSRMGTMKRDKMIEDVTEDVLEQRLQTFGLSRQESHLESTLSIRSNSSELFFFAIAGYPEFPGRGRKPLQTGGSCGNRRGINVARNCALS